MSDRSATHGLSIADDPINSSSAPGLHWTTTNVGEAAPGVQTPLSWTLWSVGDAALREMAYQLGILGKHERVCRTEADRVFQVFYGRSALQVEFLVLLGDRMPGATGQQVAASILGRTPQDIAYQPTRRRYPVIAWKLPFAFMTAPHRLRKVAAGTEHWYQSRLRELEAGNAETARRVLDDAGRRLREALTIQGLVAFGVVEPLYGAVEKLVAKAGCGDTAVLSGSGGAEVSGMVGDLWETSRGRLDLAEFVRRHGFHGPAEGELSSRVWRQDPTPLKPLLREYARLPDNADPRLREESRRRERERMVPEVLAAFPAPRRPAVRALLELAARRIPLRGIAKRCMLQAFDIARVAAIQLGEDLASRGALADPGDVYFLTRDQLVDGPPPDIAGLATDRRELWTSYQQFEIPGDWTGVPQPLQAHDRSDAEQAEQVSGIGVSTGVVEGTVRVITDPDFGDVEPDEVLVAPTTDPSWATIMMISSALVVDIGGALSHAAVVARELGIPCVVNTRSGTRALRTGDRVRVDGSSGTVEILARATAG